MSRRTWLLLTAVVLLTALPLIWVGSPPPDASGAPGELFQGADARAQQAITQIAPDYQPWFSPVLEPSSGEIASLLFALQAALGAGVIGYWLGVSKARAAMAPKDATPPDAHAVPAPSSNDTRADRSDH
ncbi:energy-coupling factor ABC transporter substrate-binding protein [Roseateles amylovorans]|uniref:Cobalt transport protein CbiN n=1 Tax=Roseateles amylovorans TaxID=2978473 RepID=A0ABY6B210_9BURK|nr:energy-coupling factor ABC transporter substrate-binding protein [Roseateles amylovorans]UXH79106.1 energy-coupling factor ABC transporter substrate-binding protein [Roseateles amylovorans]